MSRKGRPQRDTEFLFVGDATDAADAKRRAVESVARWWAGIGYQGATARPVSATQRTSGPLKGSWTVEYVLTSKGVRLP